MKDATKQGAGILGLGAVACLACCAGPVLAFLGGLSIAGLASTVVFGAAGLAVAIGAALAFLVVRRRRSTCAVPGAGPVAVATPTRRNDPLP